MKLNEKGSWTDAVKTKKVLTVNFLENFKTCRR